MERCSFCQQVDRIYEADLARDEQDRLIDELFDRAERANTARRAYGRRKGYHR